MSQIRITFRNWLLLTINSDADGMTTAFENLCRTLWAEQSNTRHSIGAELHAGLATWVKPPLHGITETAWTVLAIMTMPLPALNISASLARLFWAMVVNDYDLIKHVFIQVRARVLFELPAYDPPTMKHIVSAAFRLWGLGEWHGRRMAAARRQFHVEIELDSTWTCGCGYGPMRKSYFPQQCPAPACGDLRSWYEGRERMRMGAAAMAARWFEKPVQRGAWQCQFADWEYVGGMGAHRCRCWNPKMARYCVWCGTMRHMDALVDNDERLPEVAKGKSNDTRTYKSIMEEYEHAYVEERLRVWARMEAKFTKKAVVKEERTTNRDFWSVVLG